MVPLLRVFAFALLPFAVLSSAINQDGENGVVSERDLRRDIFANYDKLVRPARDPSTAIPLSVGISPLALRDLDENKQVIVLETWILMRWKDDYLKWDPSHYSNITYFNVPSSEIWRPDLMLYTAIDDTAFEPHELPQALIYSNGTVLWVPPFTLRSRCPVPYNKIPKDIIECNIRFGSWTYSGLKLDVQLYQPNVDISDFLDNNVNWKLINMDISREDKYYPCCPESYPLLHFNVTMKRRLRDFNAVDA